MSLPNCSDEGSNFDHFIHSVGKANGIISLREFRSRGEYSVRVPGGPSRLSFFKIWPFSAEFHITYMYDIFIYLAKIMLLRENLFMAEFFNSHQKLCQGTNDKKLIHIHNLYTPRLNFRYISMLKFLVGIEKFSHK